MALDILTNSIKYKILLGTGILLIERQGPECLSLYVKTDAKNAAETVAMAILRDAGVDNPSPQLVETIKSKVHLPRPSTLHAKLETVRNSHLT